MRSSLRVAALSLAVLAAGCTNGDKPTMDNGLPVAGPSLKESTLPGGCASTIGDRVWFDTNCDGLQDKDETGGPEGLKVELVACPGGGVVMSTATDSQGNYQFNGVAPGSYMICIEIPGGFRPHAHQSGRQRRPRQRCLVGRLQRLLHGRVRQAQYDHRCRPVREEGPAHRLPLHRRR
jgi:hypothetical protein